MIYTSYYAKYAKSNTASNVIGVQISNSRPQWFEKELISMKDLAPNWDLVSLWKNCQITEEQFRDQYIQQLECTTTKSEVTARLLDLLNEYDVVVLLCYERYGDVCHRHYLAEWLDLDIKELQY